MSTPDEIEEAGRQGAQEHRARVDAVRAKLGHPPEQKVVFDASEAGALRLIDVIEGTIEVPHKLAGDLYVKLPRGYATVEFLRMLFAVTG